MTVRTTLRVAVAQVESTLGDVSANIDKHLAYIAKARADGAAVVLFPEMSLTGHGAGVDTLRVALRRDAPEIRRLADAARGLRAIFGLIEEGPAAQFYNSLFVVADGEIEFIHRKINLATYGRLEDGKHFAAGRYVETFELSGPEAPSPWRASSLICADVWNPALVHLAALHGCTALFVPISSAVEAVGVEFDNPNGWDTNLRFYAMTYGFPVVMANRVGREGDLTFWGGSRILDPFGRVVAQAGPEEALIAGDLDYEAVRKARYLLPTVRDSNLALLQREVDRLVGIIGVPEAVRKF